MQNEGNLLNQNQVISNGSITAPSISDYMDYRKFLKDFYEFKRESTKHALRPYNYAIFSAAADIKSPNYLKMIIEGKRNLSDDMISKFSKACGMNKAESDEFSLLVLFNQAEEPADRNMALKQLSEFRLEQKVKHGEIDRKVFEKIPNWIGWIIYALLDQEGVYFSVQQLKDVLRGKVSENEVQQALNQLLESGDLVKDAETGKISKGAAKEVPDEIPPALIRRLQMQLMYLGLESLYQDEANEREFGSLTLSLTEKEFNEIKFKLRQMRKSLHKENTIARMESKGERVYQLNLQLYPVTNATKKTNA